MKIKITSIQRGCVYDGTGIRTTVFLKGCTMKCPWCCNPEAISYEDEYFIDDSKCLLRKGINSNICRLCKRNEGNIAIYKCPFGVAKPVFKLLSYNELYEILKKDFYLMKSSGGGVTLSGGEPLIQIQSLVPLLKKLKNDIINITFETTLTTSEYSLQQALEYADALFIDIKLQPTHPLYTNNEYRMTLKNRIEACRKVLTNLTFRLVFVDSMLNVSNDIIQYLTSCNITYVELLKCHNLGESKYRYLGINNIDSTATNEAFDKFAEMLNNASITVKKLCV